MPDMRVSATDKIASQDYDIQRGCRLRSGARPILGMAPSLAGLAFPLSFDLRGNGPGDVRSDLVDPRRFQDRPGIE
ncbi:MAG: hypothetical protein AAF526_00770 [Pseudomonadota bacterium]